MLLLLSGCGLESFVVLSTPTANYSAPPRTFQFTKQDTSADLNQAGKYVFQGFELYYKIYGLIESVENDIGTFEELGTHGFRRINNVDFDVYLSYHRPLIDLTTIDDLKPYKTFKITIDFSADLTDAGASTDYPLITYTAPTDPDPTSVTIKAIRRDVPYTYVGYTSEFKRFSADSRTVLIVYDQMDADLSSSAWTSISTTPNTAKIALYVLSYGYDEDTRSVLYSLPVYLGDLDNLPLPYP